MLFSFYFESLIAFLLINSATGDQQKDKEEKEDTSTAMDSSDTPPATDEVTAAVVASPGGVGAVATGNTSPAVSAASDEIGMGLREIGDELLRAYTPTGPGGRAATSAQQPGGSSVRPATQRLDSGADAASAAEEEVSNTKDIIRGMITNAHSHT